MIKNLFVLLAVVVCLSPAEAHAMGRKKKKNPNPVPSPVAQTVTSTEATFGQPTLIAGSGCPNGSASVSIAPDGSAISFLYDKFTLEAGAAVAKSTDRKTCRISIPIQVPTGFQLVVAKADHRGFASIPYGAYGRLAWEASIRDGAGESRVRRDLQLQVGTDDILWEDTRAEVTSACGGGNVTLTVDLEMYIFSNPFGEETLATLDSTDLSSAPGVQMSVQKRKC